MIWFILAILLIVAKFYFGFDMLFLILGLYLLAIFQGATEDDGYDGPTTPY